jgi:hypothetical protein
MLAAALAGQGCRFGAALAIKSRRRKSWFRHRPTTQITLRWPWAVTATSSSWFPYSWPGFRLVSRSDHRVFTAVFAVKNSDL